MVSNGGYRESDCGMENMLDVEGPGREGRGTEARRIEGFGMDSQGTKDKGGEHGEYPDVAMIIQD